MQEMTLEDQMRAQLNLQEQAAAIPQQRKPRRVKKPLNSKPLNLTSEEVSESLKTEIELLPMKTPISILQELLSRRGKPYSSVWKILLIFPSINLDESVSEKSAIY